MITVKSSPLSDLALNLSIYFVIFGDITSSFLSFLHNRGYL